MTANVIVSIAALACSIYAVYEARKQNRLTMKPHLQWHTYRTLSDDGVTFRFAVKNTGLGPAVVANRHFVLGGTPFESADPAPDLARRCLDGQLPYRLRQHSWPGVGGIISAGEEICLAEVYVSGAPAIVAPRFEALTSCVQFVTRYRSLAGDEFVLSTK